MHRRKVFLIGPMGAGKSTIGKILSRELGWQYFDNDGEMAKLSGLTIEELSEVDVEELHRLETLCFKSIYSRSAPFISGAAGSVIDIESNRTLLKDAFAIYLKLPLDKIMERAGQSGVGRQGLRVNSQDIARERFTRRDPLYIKNSKLVIELSDSAEADADIALRVLKTLKA